MNESTDAVIAAALEHGTPRCIHNWTVTSACPLCLRGRIVRLAEHTVTLAADLALARKERDALRIGMDAAHAISERAEARAAELCEALAECANVLGVIGAQYQNKIGPYATQAQAAGQRAAALAKVRP